MAICSLFVLEESRPREDSAGQSGLLGGESGPAGRRCRNQLPPFVLSPSRPQTEFRVPMAPPANWKGFLRLSLVT
jgi:hypothetical protein